MQSHARKQNVLFTSSCVGHIHVVVQKEIHIIYHHRNAEEKNRRNYAGFPVFDAAYDARNYRFSYKQPHGGWSNLK